MDGCPTFQVGFSNKHASLKSHKRRGGGPEGPPPRGGDKCGLSVLTPVFAGLATVLAKFLLVFLEFANTKLDLLAAQRHVFFQKLFLLV